MLGLSLSRDYLNELIVKGTTIVLREEMKLEDWLEGTMVKRNST
jgi:hypothetical protein